MRRKLGLGWMVVAAAALFACGDSHESDGDDESEENAFSPVASSYDAGSAGRLDAGTSSNAGSLDATASGPTPPPGAGDAMAGPNGMGPRDRADGGKGDPPKRDGGMEMMPDGGMPKPPKDDGGMPKPPKDDGGMPKPPKDDGGISDASAPDAT